MRAARHLPEMPGADAATDPRDSASADLWATRNAMPKVARPASRTDLLVGMGGFGIIAMLGALTFWTMSETRSAKVLNAQANPPTPAIPAQAPSASLPPAPPAPIPQFRPGAAQYGARAAPAPANFGAANPLATPGLVYDASALPGLAAAASAANAPANGAAGSNEEFAARASANHSSAAASASFDPATTVCQGTLLPAILETAIDTNVPGYVRAIVSADVRSFDGSRVLVPRSSRLVGQYKSGMQAGQRRVYVIWSRLIRPDGVSVAIGSPGTGFDGRSGLGGEVNTHFFERFGSAILLSVVGGLTSFGTGSTNVVIASGGQSAAAAAVGQTGQIGPTLRVRPGEPIRVFTARDLDFSGHLGK